MTFHAAPDGMQESARAHAFPESVDELLTKAKREQDARKAKAKDRPNDEPLLDVVFADQLGADANAVDELVERTLLCNAMSVIYGDSNSGKTFFAIDVGCSIARGTPWMGRMVEPGLVVYLASESPASVVMRLQAYNKHHGILVPNFAIVRSPIDLFNGDHDTGLVVRQVQALEQARGIKCKSVFADTLARVSAGANENSGEDMSVVLKHADRIRSECDTHFGFIHHTGKDAARGSRGWSGVRAHIDTEIEITGAEPGGVHVAEITKQRDLPGKGDRIGFRLHVVDLGISKWGKPITSCVVVDDQAPAKSVPGKRPSEIAGAITEFLTARGSGARKRELVDHFAGRYDSASVYRELRKMVDAKRINEVSGVVALVKP